MSVSVEDLNKMLSSREYELKHLKECFCCPNPQRDRLETEISLLNDLIDLASLSE